MTKNNSNFYYYRAFVVSLLFFLFCTSFIYAEELIGQYDVHISVNKDGSLNVIEQITYDFGTEKRHGIFRSIPVDHPQPDRKIFLDRYVDITLATILIDGQEAEYTVSENNEEVHLKIGDPDQTITGVHTYTISYTVYGGLQYLENGITELYWNAISPEWEIPIYKTSVSLHDPDGIFKSALSCTKGGVGSQDSCGPVNRDGSSLGFQISNLLPYEGITIAQELNSAQVTKDIRERQKIGFFWIPALFIWFVALGYFVYRYNTEYKVDKAIIAQYEPYKDFKPMYTGLLIDGRLDPRDISACILYLAEQGFLKITKVDAKVLFFFEVDDYEITLLKPTALIPSAFQRKVLGLFFGTFPIEGNKVTLHKLKKNMQKQKENLSIMVQLRKDMEKDLKESGFFQIHIPGSAIVSVAFGAGIGLWFLSGVLMADISPSLIYIAIGAIGSIIILLAGHRRRTTKGYEALWYLKGFKEFLSVTEKERYAFHNAPEKSPEQFMKYLPYAIAFGVEEEWAEVFKDITIPNPSWYDGGGTGFSAMSLTQSMGAFSTALASSSSPSASSGGGSVGGGGGGGGGGSW